MYSIAMWFNFNNVIVVYVYAVMTVNAHQEWSLCKVDNIILTDSFCSVVDLLFAF